MRNPARSVVPFVLVTLALAGSPALADEPADVSNVVVKEALVRTLTPEQLAAHKLRMARLPRERPARGRLPDAPGDTCSAATYQIPAFPFSVPDTTVGALDDYDLPTDTVAPTCTASSTCAGAGPAGSLPRGAIYTGTGTAPDRAFRLKVGCDCTLTITAAPQAAWDLALIVYQGTCSNLLGDCACVDDTGIAGDAESVVLNAVPGVPNHDYFVVVDGYASGGVPPSPSGPYTLTVTAPPECSALCPVDLQEFRLE